MFKRLYIRWKIWRLESKINSIYSDIVTYKVFVATMNVKYYNGKLDVEDMYNNYIGKQIDRIISIRDIIEKLKSDLRILK